MPSLLKRRDFLKLAALLPLFGISSSTPSPRPWSHHSSGRPPNILILVFDTLSARHLSLEGYSRDTTPNLARFASRSTVYHAHHSAGSFTTPGTASLLTGMYPWSHRAFHIQGTVASELEANNMFQLLGDKGYHRAAFTHNVVVSSLLYQFRSAIDSLTPARDLSLVDDSVAEWLFPNDLTPAVHSESLLSRRGDTPSSSLFLYHAYRFLIARQAESIQDEYGHRFPRGVPSHHNAFFLLEDATDWTIGQLTAMPQPFLAYYHFIPPHDPYTPPREFIGRFDDGWTPPRKPFHPLTDGVPQRDLDGARREYDEFVAYVDAEFGRLYDLMQGAGVMDSTYVLVTSDHGELFERGIWNHITPVLFEPVVHVPLLVAQPGQHARRDVYHPTSCVDVLPTLLHLAGVPRPAWCEGEILPFIGAEQPSPDRSIFLVDAKRNGKYGPLQTYSAGVIRDRFKLVSYLGYEAYDNVHELYDLREDPEELSNLYSADNAVAVALKAVLDDQLAKANQLFV